MFVKRFILFGNSPFARLMKYYVEDAGDKVVAFTVDRQYLESDTFCDKPLIAYEDLGKTQFKNDDILICVGYKNMGEIRKNVFRRLINDGYKIGSFIHRNACIASNVEMGIGNIILECVTIQPFAKIGDGNLIWPSALVAHDDTIGDFNTLCGSASLCGFVNIGNNCFIGNNSTIEDFTEIADYTLVGAGVYINRNTKKESVYASMRAKKLSVSSLELL